jgi:hypothetical protein
MGYGQNCQNVLGHTFQLIPSLQDSKNVFALCSPMVKLKDDMRVAHINLSKLHLMIFFNLIWEGMTKKHLHVADEPPIPTP